MPPPDAKQPRLESETSRTGQGQSRSREHSDNNANEEPSNITTSPQYPINIERLLGIGITMSREETLALRREIVPRSCALHFEKSPMKVSCGQGQYLYDDLGIEYLDCVNCVAHVGHCHPVVVKAGTEAMLQMGSVASNFDKNKIAESYIDTLRTTLPSSFDTFLFVSSASEANDLALQLAQLHTGGTEIVAVERSFHGSASLPNSISPRIHINQSSSQIPDYVHVLPCPDLYRGKYWEDDPLALEKYCTEGKALIQRITEEKKQKIACLIMESIMSIAGIIIPPSKWTKLIYEEVRQAGGLVIADEAQTGMGRCGTSWWAFQYQEVIPDIVTIGKGIGNGHPMAVVATNSSIASCLSNQLEFFSCDNVTAAIGASVINVIRQENLLLNARNVGSFLREGLKGMADNHKYIGDVRGVGLMIGVEVVYCKENRKPAKDIAEKICYMMKDNQIILGNDGIHKNVLIIMPPMCFTCENAHRVIRTLSNVLKIIEAEDWVNGERGSSSNSNRSNFTQTFDSTPRASTSMDPNGRFFNSSIFDESQRISLEDIGLLDTPSRFSEMD